MKLYEIKRPKTATKTQTKSTLGNINLNQPHNIGSLTTQQKPSTITQKQAQGKVASGAQTRSKLAAVMPSQDAIDKMSQMQFNPDEIDTSNEIDDDQAQANANYTPDDFTRPKPRNPENLPAVISKAMTNVAGTDVAHQPRYELEWHMVKNLPGYMSKPIRALGRQVFSPFTKTPIEDIQVLANLAGGGPNADIEIQALTNYVRHNGVRDHVAELHFQKVFPGYDVNIVSYNAEGYTFLLVQDFMGKYVYSWPTDDNKQLPTGAERKLVSQRKMH